MSRTARPSLLLSLLLCFTIVLSACSTGTANTTAGNNGNPQVQPHQPHPVQQLLRRTIQLL